MSPLVSYFLFLSYFFLFYVIMFKIFSKKWNDYTGEYSQIDSISYEVNVLQNDNDYRTNGFGNLKYAMGNFKNDIFGDYIRYTHASCHSYVVVNIDGKILVVNGENGTLH